MVSNNFQALLFLQHKLLESVSKQLIPVNMSEKLLGRPFLKKEKSAERGILGPDIPADIRPKTSVRPSKSWKKRNKHLGTDIPRGHPRKKLRSEKLRADFSFLLSRINSVTISARTVRITSQGLETGRIRFRRARLQAPNSVRFSPSRSSEGRAQ